MPGAEGSVLPTGVGPFWLMVLASGAGLLRADLPQPCDDDEVTAMGMLLGHGLNILYLDPDAGGTVLLTQSRRPRPSPPLRVPPAVRPPVIDHPGISSPSCASLSRSSAAGAVHVGSCSGLRMVPGLHGLDGWIWSVPRSSWKHDRIK